MRLLCPVDATGRTVHGFSWCWLKRVMGMAQIDRTARLMDLISPDCMCDLEGANNRQAWPERFHG